MATWTLDHPDKLTLDEVRQVLVKTVEGAVSVVGSDDRPTLELSELSGEPLRVQHAGGTLTVDYARLSANGPVPVPNGGPFPWPAQPQVVSEVRVPIPAGSTTVSLDWEYFNAESFGSIFNDLSDDCDNNQCDMSCDRPVPEAPKGL